MFSFRFVVVKIMCVSALWTFDYLLFSVLRKMLRKQVRRGKFEVTFRKCSTSTRKTKKGVARLSLWRYRAELTCSSRERLRIYQVSIKRNMAWGQGYWPAIPAANCIPRFSLKGSSPGEMRPAWHHRVRSGSRVFWTSVLVWYNPIHLMYLVH